MKTLLTTLCLTIAVLLGSVGVSFALPKCAGSPRLISEYTEVSSWSNCDGTIAFSGWRIGDKYVGEFRDGKLNGKGTYFYSNGDKYVGEIRDNKRNGQGTATFGNEANHKGRLFRYLTPNKSRVFVFYSGHGAPGDQVIL